MTYVIDQEYRYTSEQFKDATGTAGTFMSNFYQLEIPVTDEFGLLYWNSEGYYMSRRTRDADVKRQIAHMSELGGKYSRRAKYRFELDQDLYDRAYYMIESVCKKFSTNPHLAEKLCKVEGHIMEKNSWGDTFFGVSDKTMRGANMLGKILMKTRA